jgi:hypothetical protein
VSAASNSVIAAAEDDDDDACCCCVLSSVAMEENPTISIPTRIRLSCKWALLGPAGTYIGGSGRVQLSVADCSVVDCSARDAR